MSGTKWVKKQVGIKFNKIKSYPWVRVIKERYNEAECVGFQQNTFDNNLFAISKTEDI